MLNKSYLFKDDKIIILQKYSVLYDYYEKNKNIIQDSNNLIKDKKKYGDPRELYLKAEKIQSDLERSLDIIGKKEKLISLYKRWLKLRLIIRMFYKIFGNKEFNKLWER